MSLRILPGMVQNQDRGTDQLILGRLLFPFSADSAAFLKASRPIMRYLVGGLLASSTRLAFNKAEPTQETSKVGGQQTTISFAVLSRRERTCRADTE